MFKEKYENAKKFVEEHKTEIILGAISIGTIAFLGYKYSTNKKEFAKAIQDNTNLMKENGALNDRVNFFSMRVTDLEIGMENIYQMFVRSLSREESRIVFEMETLKTYIENLDKNVKINQIVNIPNAEKRLNELAIQLKELMEDDKKAEEIITYFIH